MKKAILKIGLVCLFFYLGAFNARAENVGFLSREGSRLELNGEDFYFSAANQYYLFYQPEAMVDEIFDDAQNLGLTLIRTWGSSEGDIPGTNYSFQPEPYVYDPATFEKLDYAIWRANQLNIRLIIPLVNNWPDFGGIDKYVEWSPTASTHDEFFTDQWCKDAYKAYINYFLNHVNTQVNPPRAYKDEPTIAILELANEPRLESGNQAVFQDWVEEMSAYIKSIDTNHLVSVGSEGWNIAGFFNYSYGSNYVGNNSAENIDICSFHLFPQAYDYSLNDQEALDWIDTHIDVAHSQIGKPVYMGEYGYLADRDASYQSTILYTFDTSSENWQPMSAPYYGDTLTQVEDPSYDSNGSIQYAIDPLAPIGFGQLRNSISCGIDYSSGQNYSMYNYLSGFVYLPPTAPSTLEAALFIKTGPNYVFWQGPLLQLTPGAWTKVYINITPAVNPSEVRVCGIKIWCQQNVYSGTVNFDLIQGQIGANLYNGQEQIIIRDNHFASWLDLPYSQNSDGASLWILNGHDYADYDDYGVYYPEDLSTGLVIQNFSEAMNNKSGNPTYLFDPCEDIDSWVAASSYSDASSLEVSSQFFTQGNYSLKFNYEYEVPVYDKAYWEKQNLSENWENKGTVLVDLYNPGGPTQASIVVQSDDPLSLDDYWFEYAPQNLVNGWNTLFADLGSDDWRLGSEPGYTHSIENLDEVKKFNIGVFGYSQSGSVYIDNIRIYNAISSLPGWPNSTDGLVYSSPAIGDINGDGLLELVVGSYDNKVYAWNADGSDVTGWPQLTGHDIYASPVLGNIDSDGEVEVVVGSLDYNVYAYNGDGSLVPGWPKLTNSGLYASCAIGDVSGDGQNDIVAATKNPGKVYIWQGNGTLINSWTIPNNEWIFSTPALADLDNDGADEIVIATYPLLITPGKVYVYKSDGTLLSGWPQQAASYIYSSPAIGDLEGDGSLEIVVGSLDHNIYAWHSNGSLVAGWPQTTAGQVWSSPALADLDGDGNLEIAVGSYDHNMYVYRNDGTLLSGWPKLTQGPIKSSPAVADINSDNYLDIIVGSEDGFLYAWNKDGSLVNGWPQMAATQIDSSPAVVDFDSDGKIEIAVGSGNLVHAWDLNGTCPNNAIPWPMFRHDKNRSGRYEADPQPPSINIIYPQEGQIVPTPTPTITWATTGIGQNENLKLIITHKYIYNSYSNISILKKVMLAIANFFEAQPAFALPVRPLIIEDLNIVIPNTGSYLIPSGVLVSNMYYTLKLIKETNTNINDLVNFQIQ